MRGSAPSPTRAVRATRSQVIWSRRGEGAVRVKRCSARGGVAALRSRVVTITIAIAITITIIITITIAITITITTTITITITATTTITITITITPGSRRGTRRMKW
jgi:hypothetical protein